MFGIHWYRVKAIVIRALYAERRNITRISETFYWPFMDIVIWGFLGTWVQQTNMSDTTIQALILIALAFWEIILRTNVEITSTILEELRNHSLLNLFSSPITLREWIIALMISAAKLEDQSRAVRILSHRALTCRNGEMRIDFFKRKTLLLSLGVKIARGISIAVGKRNVFGIF